MAKKYRVKYAFGTPALYKSYKEQGKLDEYTVYFIAEEGAKFGTFYRGEIAVGTACAEELVFAKDETLIIAKSSDDSGDLVIEIPAGTNLVDVVTNIYKKMYNDDDTIQEQINVLNGDGSVPGSVATSINTAFAEHFETDLYTRTDCDLKFLTHDDMGKLEELIAVFTDPETGKIDEEIIDTIVEAAKGIQEVVKDFYKKPEVDELLAGKDNKNIIETYDTSAGFPDAEHVNVKKFYVDDEEGIVYRWGLNEDGTAREYVEISGSGGGPGGDVKLETKIYIKGGKTTLSIAKGRSLDVQFVFSSANTMTQYNKKTHQFEKIQQQTGTIGSAKYYLDGVQFDSGSVAQSNYNETDDSKNNYNTITIPGAKFIATTHELKIVASDIAGNSATEIININVVSATITSSYIPTPTNLINDIKIPVTITSTGLAELFYSIDGEPEVKVADVPVGSPVISVNISSAIDGGRREHGYHTIKLWATTYIAESDTTIQTAVLSYDVIWYDPSVATPIITSSFSATPEDGEYNLTQYDYATLTYQLYPAGTVQLIIKDKSTGIERIVNTLAVDTLTKSWTYTYDTVGSYELYVKALYNGGESFVTSTKYTINVAKSDAAMDPTPGSVLFYTAKNRSNDEANPAQWRDEIGGIDASLQGFLWNANSGWSTNGATTSLKVAGGARCVIPFQPFKNDLRETGQVIEFDFSTSNLSDSTAKVISCYSSVDKSGIEITATGAYFSSAEFGQTTDGDARIFVPFKENERIRLAFVITPNAMDEEGHGPNDPEAVVSLWDGTQYSDFNSIELGWWRFVKVYINGVCVGIQNYNGLFMQNTPANIVIGSDDATVDIYSIRAYNTVLYDRSIVNNYIADTQDPAEKLRLFKRNNILNEAGTDVEPTALRRLMPCLFVTCESDAIAEGIVNNEHILPTNKNDKRGVTIFFDCDGLDDDAKKYYNFCHTFVAFNVQMTVQGTSSQYYPRRNWKLTFKPDKAKNVFPSDGYDAFEQYNKISTSSKPTYIFEDVSWTSDIETSDKSGRATVAERYKDNYQNKYILKDYSEEFSGISDADRTVDEISSIRAKKFCLKADFAESSGTHNTGMAKYVDFMLKSMGYDYLTPPQKAQWQKSPDHDMVDVTFRTTVDGYPIAMFWRQRYGDPWEFYGKFNFNTDKGAEATFGFIDIEDGGIDESVMNPTTGQPFVIFDEDYYDNCSQEDRVKYVPPVECWEFTNNSTSLCKFKNVTADSFHEMSSDAGGENEAPAWLGSFEARHPDNDNMIDVDYGTGLKIPTNWEAFCRWVSGTDRTGNHNDDPNYPVPSAWNGTYEDLIAGASEKEIFASYDGRLSEMIVDEETEFDYSHRYILQPTVVDPGDGTISPDLSYDLYGHIVHYNSTSSEWYDSEKELDTWVDDGLYEETDTEIDYTKAYYINLATDSHYNKVYKFNTTAKTWDNFANISDYALAKPVVYNMITYNYDTAEYRIAKFKNELKNHMNIYMTTAYYVMTEFFGCADQRAKNMMFASWGYEPGASNVKPANAFSSEEAANAAGYKGVYKYELKEQIINAAPAPVYAAKSFAAPAVFGATVLAPDSLVISECDPNNKLIELHNTTDSELNLIGLTIKRQDETGTLDAESKWYTFTEESPFTKIRPHGYATLGVKGTAPAAAPFGLSGSKWWTLFVCDGEDIISSISNGESADDYYNIDTDKTFGIALDGSCGIFDNPTMGRANAQNIVINEIDANSSQKAIELFNPTANDINLEGWTLKKGDDLGNVESDKSVVFTSAAVVPALGFFVVNCTKSSTAPNVLPSGISAKNGFALRLYDASEVLVDEVNNGADAPGFVNFDGQGSLGRANDGDSAWKVFAVPTIGSTNDPIVPEYDTTELTVYAVHTTNVTEFSGICRNDSDNGFYAVSDKGYLFTVDEGGVSAQVACSGIADKDLEGLTRAGDDIYMITEREIKKSATSESGIYKLAADRASASLVATVNPVSEDENSGFEAIAHYSGTEFFVGSQFAPVAIYKVDIADGMNITPTLVKEVDFVDDIADMFYDGTNLWILDSVNAYLAKCTVDGELVERFHLPITEEQNPEALCIVDGNAWIGCDNGGKEMFKVSLSNDPFDTTIVINECDPNLKLIEFYNTTNNNIDLNGYYIVKDDEISDPTSVFTFGSDAIVPAKGRYILSCKGSRLNPDGETPGYAPFGLSATKGFDFKLYKADGSMIEHVNNPKSNVIPDDMTWGRMTDGAGTFVTFKNHGNIGKANETGIINAGICINEVDTTGNELGKRFEIYNHGTEPYDLTGHKFVKDSSEWSVVETAVGYGIPKMIIPSGEYIIVQCDATDFADAAKNPTFGISGSKGFVLGIKNAAGVFVDKIDNSKAGNPNFVVIDDGQTFGRYPDGDEHNFRIFETPSLGSANVGGIKYVPIVDDTATGYGVFINEIEPGTDRFEIYNSTSAAVDLAGFTLSKWGDSLTRWIVPTANGEYTIPAGGFLLIEGKHYDSNEGPIFGASATKGFLFTLANTDGKIIDFVDNRVENEDFVAISEGQSYGRIVDGSPVWARYSRPSMGETNANGEIYVKKDVDPGDPITDRIVINEICGDSKYIELYNPTSNAITLGGVYGLVKTDTDEYSATDWFVYPAGAIIPAKGYYTVKADKTEGNPQFGISLKSGKVFHLYLRKITGSVDTSSLTALLNSTTAVDDIDNMTDPKNCEDGSYMTLGRVHDGTTNWALFNAPGTMFGGTYIAGGVASTANETMKNDNGEPIEGGTSEVVTVKTPLYWVPIDAEYIWYPIFYDNDTILSLDNTGHIKFDPNVESTDKVGTGYAYNGTESVLWMNFKDAFAAEIASTYVNMRSKGGLTYQNCMKYFNEGQCDCWPENVYNIDGKFKYVVPATKGYKDYSTQGPDGKYGVNLRANEYLYACQGSREEHRKWWLNNRFTYMDSRYFANTYAEDYATIRLYTPTDYAGVEPKSTFKITPYADMYLRVMFGQIVSTVRAEKNKTYDIVPSDPDLRFNDTETIIYGASNILSFGDMSNKYAGSVAISKASKITDLILGADEPYYNKNIKAAGVAVGATNSTLKNIDVRGCTTLTGIEGLNQLTSIEKVNAERTGVTALNFSTAGANLNEVHYPTTVAEIKLVNMKNISMNGLSIPSYANLQNVWIENCPLLSTSSWNILYNILSTNNNVLRIVRITNANWTINTPQAFAAWTKLLTLKGYGNNGSIINTPYLSGTVTIGAAITVSTGYKAAIENLLKDAGGLTVNVTTTASMTGIAIKPENEGIIDNIGSAVIKPYTDYKFLASYLPDDFVLDSEKGVDWIVDSNLVVVEQTDDYIILRYNHSTDGNRSYLLSAKSKKDATKTAELYVRPSSTISAIKITDTLGREVIDDVDLEEASSVMFNISFIPEDTIDTQLDINVINGDYIEYVYDPSDRTLVVTGKDVSTVQVAYIVVSSHNVPTVRKEIKFNVKNVVSRIVNLYDGDGNKIPGYIEVSYINAESGVAETDVARSATSGENVGVITLPTNAKWGFGDLTITPHANAENTELYNQPETFVMNAIATSASEDVTKDVTFYKPITATIEIKNAGADVTDRVMKIYSPENETTRALTTPPYNNVLACAGAAGNPAQIKLLANTTHNIKITELDEHGSEVVSGGRYSQYIGKLTTTTADGSYVITISRDYLGTVNDSIDFRMTVATGSTKKILRLYVKTTGACTIDWGDRDENPLNYTKEFTGATSGEEIIYHEYKSYDREYDINVSTNRNVAWMHVIPMNATYMLPCFGTTQSADGFNLAWKAEDDGGLVAYEAIGAATIEQPMRFEFASGMKKYSRLLCVGNIYKSNTNMTTAKGLFKNTTVEQISSIPMFQRCTEITSFEETFMNSNITTLPINFFITNNKVTTFKDCFNGCTELSSTNTEENVPFIKINPGVEVESLEHMFYNCTSLSSEVPALWKTFYGCSFVVKTPQKSFENCGKVANFGRIPGRWGGNIAAPEYSEDAYKRLAYIKANDTVHTRFICDNIYPKGNWGYELELAFIDDLYEMEPMFGSAIGTSEETVTRVLDFSRAGQTDGTKGNIYTAYLTQRLDTAPDADWSKSSNVVGGAPEILGKTYNAGIAGHGNSGDHIMLSISHRTEPGYGAVWAQAKEFDADRAIFNIPTWADAADYEATLPLMIMDIYNTHPLLYKEAGPGYFEPEDPEHPGRNYRGKNIIFYEMKIFDENDSLIHDLVPVYGVHPLTGELAAFLHDTIADNVYLPDTDDATKLKYYMKNE